MGTPDKPRITPQQVERATALQAQGYTHARIASELGVSRLTVTRQLAKINKRATERILRRLSSEKGRQLSILDHTIERALEQWEASTRDVTTVKTTIDGAGVPTEVATTVKGQNGNPAFLAEAIKALAERRKILGLDRPTPDEAEDPLIVAEMVKERYAPEDDDPTAAARNVATRNRESWAERQVRIG